jgi:tetratricopeptide (TPR) repeat protein
LTEADLESRRDTIACVSRNAAVAVAAVLVGAVLVSPAGADPAAARKLNGAGMKAYKKHDYEAAQQLFEKAIAEDPTFVKAHYNRASMAALQGDHETMAEELTWLRKSTDPDAARVLAKSTTDPDFAGVRTIDAARIALGLPALADTPVDQVALGYGGRWSGVDDGMMEGWVEIRFQPKHKVSGRDHDGESGEWYPWKGTWKVDGRKIVITKGKAAATWELKACPEGTGFEGMNCLVRDDGGVSVGPG